jgi:hypothetical protein
MPKFLIIEPESVGNKKLKRGSRGRNLVLFLRKYYGKDSVCIIPKRKLTQSNLFSVDHLFVGVPSSIEKTDIKKIRYKKAHLFDYQDKPGAFWGGSDQELLRGLTDSYLKSWIESNWDEGFNWGCLPIRRYRSLPLSIKWNRWRQLSATSKHPRLFDTNFLGNPNVNWVEDYQGNQRTPRVQWLQEVANSHYSFSGGFILGKKATLPIEQGTEEPDQQLIWSTQRVGFNGYFKMMLDSKTALVPPGNARWSYRHYESIYAGCIPISANFQDSQMLIPLPVNGMIHVEPGGSIINSLEDALRKRKDNPDTPMHNLAHLEQYLTDGAYDCRKTNLLQRFHDQLI